MKHHATPPPGIGRLTSTDGSVTITPASGKGAVVNLAASSGPQPVVMQKPPNAGTVNAVAVQSENNWWIGGAGLNVPGLSGNYCLMHTTDAGTTWTGWTLAALGASGLITAIAIMGSTLVAFSNAGLHTTTNGGTSWTTFGGITNAAGGLTVWKNLFIAYAPNFVPYWSADGLTWTAGTGSASANQYSCAGSADNTVMWRSNGNLSYYSNDGKTWAAASNPPAGSSGRNGLTPIGGENFWCCCSSDIANLERLNVTSAGVVTKTALTSSQSFTVAVADGAGNVLLGSSTGWCGYGVIASLGLFTLPVFLTFVNDAAADTAAGVYLFGGGGGQPLVVAKA